MREDPDDNRKGITVPGNFLKYFVNVQKNCVVQERPSTSASSVSG